MDSPPSTERDCCQGKAFALASSRKPPRAVRVDVLAVNLKIASAGTFFSLIDYEAGDSWKPLIEDPMRKVPQPLNLQTLARRAANIVQAERSEDARVRGECFEVVQINRRSAIDQTLEQSFALWLPMCRHVVTRTLANQSGQSTGAGCQSLGVGRLHGGSLPFGPARAFGWFLKDPD